MLWHYLQLTEDVRQCLIGFGSNGAAVMRVEKQSYSTAIKGATMPVHYSLYDTPAGVRF